MKVAFICYDATRFTFLRGLYDLFQKEGHHVRAFYEHNVLPGHVRCRWLHFQMDALIEYKPDRVIIFNGFAPASTLAAVYIKNRYNTYFVERGWLPQDGNIYIDKEGLGGRSSLAKKDLSILPEGADPEPVYKLLKEKFKPGPDPRRGDYILVPLQLEGDTQILIDSPHVKTMKSLVDYASCMFYDKKLLVKTHPRGPKFDHPAAISDIDMNTLAYYSRGIVGINSTSLIEALVHMKPVVSLGNSVISSSGVTITADAAFKGVRALLAYTPPLEKVKAVLYNLYNTQFHKDRPPVWVVRKVEALE